MKRRIIALIFILFSGFYIAGAQVKLVVGSMDTPRVFTYLGDKYLYVSYILINKGSTTFVPYGTWQKPGLQTVAAINQKDTLADQGDYLPYNYFNQLKPNDSVLISTSFKIDDLGPILKSGVNANIVVIWPTGNGLTTSPTVNGDSTFFTYSITTDISTPQNLKNALKFFPDPAINSINILNTNTTLTIKNIQLLNIGGQKVTNYNFDGKSIDLSQISAGVYFLEVMFSDGETGKYKIVKAAN